jgi:hypothetical protein
VNLAGRNNGHDIDTVPVQVFPYSIFNSLHFWQIKKSAKQKQNKNNLQSFYHNIHEKRQVV